MRLLILPLAALAALVAADSTSTFSQQFCKTALYTKKGSGGTTTKASTIYLTRTIESTVTPTITVTPKSVTCTRHFTTTVSTTKTLPQTTNTFSKTELFTETSTVLTTFITTSTSTSFETTTSTLDTTTVAASGVIPISSALAANGHTVSKKRRRSSSDRVQDARPVAIQERAVAQRIICGSDGTITFDPPQYSGTVTCFKAVQIVTTKVLTSTAKKTRTMTAPQRKTTKTLYTTRTKTLTETPVAASTTVTFSHTDTITTTSTASSTVVVPYTTTSTIYAPQPTAYTACSKDNIASFVDGKRIYNIAVTDPNHGFSFGSNTADAYSCCAQCVQSGTCGGSTWHPASGTCYFFPVVGATCSPTSQSGTFLTQNGTNLGFEVSNSPCGEVALG
ncbi:hypothetical protein DOTSEDRAFT_76918 [Dothistroma septosporum NZE10]|uniref:Apple domain-containing protein n=1 Tax=Dothistroma septosporum (strain NZE10 / CBS 128990) TaxID=675120 RepID=N1Q4G8_DOTSN|nr:hypothetical protein DOTSEDRAFT_76918 [Dothistroma septosporum NZE10]